MRGDSRLLGRVLLEPVVSDITLVLVTEGLCADGPVQKALLILTAFKDFAVFTTSSFVEHQLAALAFSDTDIFLREDSLEIIKVTALLAGCEYFVTDSVGVMIGVVHAVVMHMLRCLFGRAIMHIFRDVMRLRFLGLCFRKVGTEIYGLQTVVHILRDGRSIKHLCDFLFLECGHDLGELRDALFHVLDFSFRELDIAVTLGIGHGRSGDVVLLKHSGEISRIDRAAEGDANMRTGGHRLCLRGGIILGHAVLLENPLVFVVQMLTLSVLIGILACSTECTDEDVADVVSKILRHGLLPFYSWTQRGADVPTPLSPHYIRAPTRCLTSHTRRPEGGLPTRKVEDGR